MDHWPATLVMNEVLPFNKVVPVHLPDRHVSRRVAPEHVALAIAVEIAGARQSTIGPARCRRTSCSNSTP